MNYETLDFSVAAGFATITLNRPKNMNAMSPQMAAELHEAALAIDADSKIRAVVLIGAGNVFSAMAVATTCPNVRKTFANRAGCVRRARRSISTCSLRASSPSPRR